MEGGNGEKGQGGREVGREGGREERREGGREGGRTQKRKTRSRLMLLHKTNTFFNSFGLKQSLRYSFHPQISL